VTHLEDTGRRLKGKVLAIDKTGETTTKDAETWTRCIFTIEITRFSKRTPYETVPEELKGRKIKLVRYCLYDWHYRLGIEKTLSPHETNCVMQGRQSSTVFW